MCVSVCVCAGRCVCVCGRMHTLRRSQRMKKNIPVPKTRREAMMMPMSA
ncbi:MAG: hypothetical protein P4L40_18495 [Terracidiphilus sp.]|nr:hypothetical protein [Terracidiphilus sp.]